jgi:hypothetical protein
VFSVSSNNTVEASAVIQTWLQPEPEPAAAAAWLAGGAASEGMQEGKMGPFETAE